jgi:26S proteasome regulatory subunit N6
MRAVCSALEHRSLDEFQKALEAYPTELTKDFGVGAHVKEMNDQLFEQHLTRLIEPFSVVEISHIAELIGIPEDIVERKFVTLSLSSLLHRCPFVRFYSSWHFQFATGWRK